MSVLLKSRAEIALRSLNQPERRKVHKAILSLEKASDSGELIKRHHWRLNLLKLPSQEKLYSFRVGKTLRLILSSHHKSQWIVEDIIDHDRLARLLSIFKKKRAKTTPDWASRLECAFSQLLDWLWKLDDMRSTADFQYTFGDRQAKFQGLIIIGKDMALGPQEASRLKWRVDKVIVDSTGVSCVSFNDPMICILTLISD